MVKQEYTIKIVVLLFSVMLVGMVLAQSEYDNWSFNEEVPICSEQLQICIIEFNSLLSDFREGINCYGEAFEILKESNQNLSIQRDAHLDEVNRLKNYRLGFYAILTLLIFFVLFYFTQILKDTYNPRTLKPNKLNKRRNG